MARSWGVPVAVAVTAVICFGMQNALQGTQQGTPAATTGTATDATKSPLDGSGQADAPKPSSGGLLSGLSLSSLFGAGDKETTLPQDPKADAASRKEQLVAMQAAYRWRSEGIPVGLPYLEGFPPEEDFPTFSWIHKFVHQLVRILLGAVRGTIGMGEILEAISDPSRAANFANRIGELIKDSKINERPVDIGDYEDLHAFPMKTPESSFDYDDDDAFARQRLQGANCVVIEKCSPATRKKLKILDSDPSYESLKTKVDSLLAAGKLFVVDQELLKDMEPSPLDGEITRYLTPSIALFEAVDDELLPIKPIGMQLSQGETATPIFTPEDGYNWLIAKACFEAADFIIHEVISHLGNTHLVMEAPMVSMHRQLPKEHPIHVLLEPHLEGTAFINWGAQELLMAKGNGVDRLQANKIEDSWSMLLEQTLARISKDFSPGADFKARGVTKEELPGRYPYRDTGLKYWEATHAWVTEYLNIYYKNDGDIAADYELQATLCSGHKVDGMQNVFDKSCSAPACRKVPTFGPEDGKATACASHKTLGMVNVRNPRCEMQGCSKQPRFGTLGDKPRVCLDHTQNGMTELRPVHQGRTKKLRTFDAGTFPGATSPASLPPGLPHTGQLAGVTGQPAVPHLAFLPPSMALTTRTSILQGVEFDRVAPQAVGREGIMPQAFMPGGFSSQGFASADFSAQNVVPQGATTEEMPQAPTPGESGTEGAAGDSGMPVSDALQAVEPNSTGLQSMAMSPAMVTEQPASTHPVGLESETTVSARSAGQSVSTHSSGLPSEAMPPVFTTTGSPLPPNPTDLHSTDVSPATTTGEPDSTNSTGLQSESTMRMASTTGQLVSTNATGLQPETMAPEMTIRQPISTSSTTLHSTEMPPAMATGQPDATHSTGLQPEAVVVAGSTGVVDMPMGPPGGVPNAAPPNMQPAVYRSQACQKHKQSGMTYGFGSKCRFGGCVEQPQYGFDDEGPRFCGCHKRDGMSARTTASNCEVEHSEGRAMDGLDSPSQGQSYVHQAAAMMGSDAVKMHHKFCVWESCLQPPLYSWSGEDSPRFCETHASPGMVPPSTGGHPCRYHGCLKQACFAFEGEACRFCQEHCLDGMLEAEGRQCYHQGCTGLAPYSSDLSPVKDGYPSLPPSSGSISPLADDAASHDMPSQMSHHFSGDRDGHHGMVDDAIGASNNVDEIGYLRSGSGGGGSPPLGNEDATSVHAEDGGQSALLPPSPRRDVGVDMAPHSDEAREHHPSPFQPQH